MKTFAFKTESEQQSHDFGLTLGSLLKVGDFVGLSGQLGAGKTLISRAVAEGAGIDPQEVSSPTYSILQSYQGPRLNLLHADLYRLTDEADLYATGYFDLLETEAAFLVEWIERVPSAAPADALLIAITVNEDQRSFDLRATGTRAEALLAAIAAALSANGQ